MARVRSSKAQSEEETKAVRRQGHGADRIITELKDKVRSLLTIYCQSWYNNSNLIKCVGE
jgi:hypothetical protein